MTCHVYLIAHLSGDRFVPPVKVGIASSPETRLKSLQTGNPRELALAYSFPVPDRDIAKLFEGAFHHIQKDKRLVGEWFDMPARDALARICLYIDVALHGALEDEDLIQESRERCGPVAALQLLDETRQEDGRAQH